VLLRQGIFFYSLKGELEDVQDMPAPEPALGSVLAANLSITLQDDRSEGSNLPSASTSDSAPQCDASSKEDAGENTALLGKCLASHKMMLAVGGKNAEKQKGKMKTIIPYPQIPFQHFDKYLFRCFSVFKDGEHIIYVLLGNLFFLLMCEALSLWWVCDSVWYVVLQLQFTRISLNCTLLVDFNTLKSLCVYLHHLSDCFLSF